MTTETASLWDLIAADAIAVGATGPSPTFQAAGYLPASAAFALFSTRELTWPTAFTSNSGKISGPVSLPNGTKLWDAVSGGLVATRQSDGTIEFGAGATFVLNNAKGKPAEAFFINYRTDLPLPAGTPEGAQSVNLGFILNGLDKFEKLAEKFPKVTVVQLALKAALELASRQVGVWGGVALRLEVLIDASGHPTFYKGGKLLVGFEDTINQIEAVFDEINALLGDGDDTVTIDPAIQQNLAKIVLEEGILIKPDGPYGLVTVTDFGVVTQNGTRTQAWYEGKDGTHVTAWDGNIAITYADGTVYIETAAGQRTLYDSRGGVVRQSTELMEKGGSGIIQKFNAWLGSDMLATVPPDFARAFPYGDAILTGAFAPQENPANVKISTVMRSDGLAKAVVIGGVTKFIVYDDGRVVDLASMIGADGKLAPGVKLEDVLENAEAFLELWRASQATQTSVLDTWETQYKAPIDRLILQLNDPKHAIIFQQIPELRDLITKYNQLDGSVRFLGNLAKLMQDKGRNPTGSIDGAIAGLITLLNSDNNLSNDDKNSFKGRLETAAFAAQVIMKAQQAFSPNNPLEKRLGFANDSILALGSLAALGVVDSNFAKYAALTYGGATVFLRVKAALAAAEQNPADTRAYDKAIDSAVGLIGQLGKMGVINADLANAVRGSYAAYGAVTTGLEIYDNWGANTPATLNSVGSFLAALSVLGQVGWLSDEAAKAIADVAKVYNVVNTGYTVASQGFTVGNTGNFALAIAALAIDDQDLNKQAVVAFASIFANAFSGNVVGAVASFLSFVGIMGARDDKKEAERIARYEATRYQLANIAENVDVDGNGVSIDSVRYEYNIDDTFIYLLGEPELAVSRTEYSLGIHRQYVHKEAYTNRYFYTIDNSDAASRKRNYIDSSLIVNITPYDSRYPNSGPYWADLRTIQVTRWFEAPTLGAYANTDVRVVHDIDNDDYGPASMWHATRTRDELMRAHRTHTTRTFLTADQYAQAQTALGTMGSFYEQFTPRPGTAAYIEEMARLNTVNTLAPIPDDVRLAYMQMNENLGVTLFKDMNGDGILDKVTQFASLGGQTKGDDSTLVQLLNANGHTYMAYALSKEAAGTGAASTINLATTGALTMAGRAIRPWGQVNLASLGLQPADEASPSSEMHGHLGLYKSLTTVGAGRKYLKSTDGRFVTVYEGNILKTYNADGTLLAQVVDPFKNLPSADAIHGMITNGVDPWLQQQGLAAAGVVSRVFTGIQSTWDNFPPLDATPLGLDIRGLKAGVMTIGGVEIFGLKDYAEAPLSESETLAYVSYVASLKAGNSPLLPAIGADAYHPDPAVVARAARVYVARVTSLSEFLANNELPKNIAFDAQAYLTANPDLVAPSEATVLGRLNSGSLIDGDIARLLDIFQKAAIHYIDRGADAGRVFGGYTTDLNGDNKTDIVRVSQDGLVTATISVGGSQDIPFVTDFVSQNGRFLGLRRDIDGDGIADSVAAPTSDGGVWTATLSSNGVVARARTSDAAQMLALAGPGLRPGAGGVMTDVNGDGVVDRARVLADGSGEVTLGRANPAAENGVELTGKVYSGQTLQDAVGATNALALLAWTAGNENLILAYGANVQAAQVAFSRAGSYDGALNLGQFALGNEALLKANGGDIEAALRSFITARRASILVDRAIDVTRQTTGAQSFLSALDWAESAHSQGWGLDAGFLNGAAYSYDSLLRGLGFKSTSYTLINFREAHAAFVLAIDPARNLAPETKAALTAAFVNGPVRKAIEGMKNEIQDLGSLAQEVNLARQGKLDFVFDYNTLIGARMQVLTGNMTSSIKANDATPLGDVSLKDIAVSEELQVAMARKMGFVAGTNGDDVFSGQVKEQNKYNGLAGNDSISGGQYRDILNGGDGNDQLRGAAGDDILSGGAGADVIYGGDGDDLAHGGSGNDSLQGEFGDDILLGQEGSDFLFGGYGKDILIGGVGHDTLKGDHIRYHPITGVIESYDPYADMFVFERGGGQDEIVDFRRADGDKIVLDIAGIGSFTSLLGAAAQVGADTVFNFGGGDVLILKNVALSTLAASDFVFGRTAIDNAAESLRTRNNAPVLVNAIPDRRFNFREAVNFTIPTDAFKDFDNQTLSFSASLLGGVPLPAWLSFNAPTRTFSGTPPLTYGGTFDIAVTASDGRSSVSDTFSLTIRPGAEAAATALKAAISSSTMVEGYANAVSAALGDFKTAMSASGQPWPLEMVQLDAAVVKLQADILAINSVYYNPNRTSEIYTVSTAFKDSAGRIGVLALVDLFNEAPVVAIALPDVNFNENSSINFALPANSFVDNNNSQFASSNGSEEVVLSQPPGIPDSTGYNFIHITTSNGMWTNGKAGVSNYIVGSAGGDLIAGTNTYADILLGGAGNDSMNGRSGNDYLSGGDGNDSLIGDWGDDRLLGDAGDDGLQGYAGNDWLYGGDGNDTLSGNEGDDTLFGGNGNDHLDSGTGLNNRLYGGAGNDSFYAGSGGGVNLVYGGSGDDRFVTFGGVNLLDGGVGIDTVEYLGGREAFDVKYNADGTHTVTKISDPARVDTLRNVEFINFKKDSYSNDVRSVTEFTTAAMTLSATLANGSPLPAWLVFNGVNFTGTPPQDYNGSLEIRVTASDGKKATSDTFTLTINPVDSAPVARNDSGLNVEAGRSLRFASLDLLRNDADADGDSLEIISVQNAANGVVSLDQTGYVIFTPNRGYTGAASFNYTISDGNGGTSSASVTIMVSPNSTASASEDFLVGTSGADTIQALAGDDIVQGLSGNDSIYGGDGDDELLGNAGNDVLNGEAGADSLFGEADNDSLSGGDGDDRMFGGDGDDNLTGDAGNDLLSGGIGRDVLSGGGGGDSVFGDSGNDQIRGGDGNDQLSGDGDDDDIWGDAGNDLLSGGDGQDELWGGADNDTLDGGAGSDALIGGLGDDTYHVDAAGDVVTEAPGQGADTVRTTLASYTLGANVENLAYTGAAAFTGTGNALNNVITGGAMNDTLSGGDGHDTLDGGAGSDILIGGLGDDIYHVDAAGDVVTENANEGTDTVRTTLASYTLGANVENLAYTGAAAFTGTGNALNNVITGGAMNDTLNGGAGSDTLIGGLGDDTYHVDVVTDVVTESANEGTDTVRTHLASYTLGANVENLAYTGAAAFTGTGNALNNSITGGAANDTLDGGAGSDTLIGGLGNDTYHVDVATDVVTENANEGVDSVGTSLASYTLGVNVENLYYTGAGAFTGTGNTLNNRIFGGATNDTLNGGAGNDELFGGAGSDILIGGLGNDIYHVDAATDVVTEALGQGTDTVQTTLASYTLGANVENLAYTGTGAFTGTGNALNNSISGKAGNDTLSGGVGDDRLHGDEGNDALYGGDGNDTLTGGAGSDILNGDTGNDTLDGGAGTDTMAGGLGDDTYHVDVATDVVTEAQGQGTDTVRTHLASYTLGADVENLAYTGAAAFTGTGNALNNAITGGGANDTLSGGGGNDTLNGRAGSDILIGGLGDDTYHVDVTTDVVTENANEGADSVGTSLASYTLGANVENLAYTGTGAFTGTGNALNNAITGGAANDTLSGGDGNDTLNGGAGLDTLIGGLGDDTYHVDVVADVVTENANEGTDTVRTHLASYTLGANVENLAYTGTGAFTGTGNALNNAITGGAANDTLSGGDGNDTLNGGAGLDTLIGGLGDDTYHVDVVADVVTENANEGTDTVRTHLASYTLGANVENLAYTGAAAFTGTGNALNNAITGGAANDTLDGGAGSDTLIGGLGNDTYHVDVATDVVTEAQGQGIDTVRTTLASYTLGANVENLAYTGAAAFTGTGNALNNTITGGAANDTLDGGAGLDILIGGLGDDTYHVDAATDVVTEALGQGTDTVQTTLASYTLGANVEVLFYTGTAAFTGIGNALNNNLLGNWLATGPGILNGEAGNDTLNGGAGNDTLNGGADNDWLDGRMGNDRLNGGDGDDTFSDEWGLNIVDGGAGSDILLFNLSQHLYTLARNADGSHSISRIGDTANVTTFMNVETVRFAGVSYALSALVPGPGAINNGSAITVTGGDGNDTLAGGPLNDTLDGGAGWDTMAGGLGDDTYIVDSVNDVVTEAPGAGIDTIRTALTQYALADDNYRNVENLTYTGTEAFAGNGNALDNTLTGGAGNDTLNDDVGNDVLNGGDGDDLLAGGAGSDTMIGGTGNDIYVVDVATDVVTENENEGWDTVHTHLASYTLGANVENLAYTGTGAFTGTGNALNNAITGGAANDTLSGGDGNDSLNGRAGSDILIGDTGNDTLDGGAGSDTMIGGTGNDIYVVDIATDVVTENANEGTDTVRTHLASYTLGANVENLAYTGRVVLTGTGNALNNAITGGTANDTLDGGLGNDALNGGLGNDTLIGGAGADRFVYSAAGFGLDTIQDFWAGAGETDLLEFKTSVFASWQSVLNASAQVGADTVITLNVNDKITLKNVALSSLNVDHVRFVA